MAKDIRNRGTYSVTILQFSYFASRLTLHGFP